jgi:hypothetical protein
MTIYNYHWNNAYNLTLVLINSIAGEYILHHSTADVIAPGLFGEPDKASLGFPRSGNRGATGARHGVQRVETRMGQKHRIAWWCGMVWCKML